MKYSRVRYCIVVMIITVLALDEMLSPLLCNDLPYALCNTSTDVLDFARGGNSVGVLKDYSIPTVER